MRIRGYYAILDVSEQEAADVTRAINQIVARAVRLLRARPCALQLRMKGGGAGDLATLARAIQPATRAAGVPLCVNDRLDVALLVGAEAVHLGQHDLPLTDARNVSRGRLLVGVSTHNLDQARAAVAGGADYLGFGPIYGTASKANPDPVVGVEALREVATRIAAAIPVVAIGGITPERAAAIAATGAAAAAVIGAIEGAADPVAAGLAGGRCFRRPLTTSRGGSALPACRPDRAHDRRDPRRENARAWC